MGVSGVIPMVTDLQAERAGQKSHTQDPTARRYETLAASGKSRLHRKKREITGILSKFSK